MKILQANGWFYSRPHDTVWPFRGNIFDFHTALCRCNDHDPLGGAIQNEAQINLSFDGHCRFDIDAVNAFALGARLVRNKLMSEQRFTDCEDLIIAAAKLYATGFSATARMYLSFHNPTLAPQFAGAIGGLLWAICQSARRYLHAEIRQDFFRLVFVDIHDLFLKTGAAEWGGYSAATAGL